MASPPPLAAPPLNDKHADSELCNACIADRAIAGDWSVGWPGRRAVDSWSADLADMASRWVIVTPDAAQLCSEQLIRSGVRLAVAFKAAYLVRLDVFMD